MPIIFDAIVTLDKLVDDDSKTDVKAVRQQAIKMNEESIKFVQMFAALSIKQIEKHKIKYECSKKEEPSSFYTDYSSLYPSVFQTHQLSNKSYAGIIYKPLRASSGASYLSYLLQKTKEGNIEEDIQYRALEALDNLQLPPNWVDRQSFQENEDHEHETVKDETVKDETEEERNSKMCDVD